MSERLRSLMHMTQARFLHTADWQLGMRRWFFGDRQSSFDDSRMNSVRRLLDVARERDAQFVLGVGDLFDANSIDTSFVIRVLRLMGEAGLPIYLLPGNHDALEPGSVFRSQKFREYQPSNVHVLDTAEPIEVAPGVFVVGAPIESKYPLPVDLNQLVASFAGVEAGGPGAIRILAVHGGTDAVFGGTDQDSPGIEFQVAELDALLESGKVHYIAMGDRHSTTAVGATGRAWYSGAPEVTDFDNVETASGNALFVTASESTCEVEEIPTGAWKLLRQDHELTSGDDVARLRGVLDLIDNKERTVVKLMLSGSVTLEVGEQLDRLLEDYAGLFANVFQRRASHVVRRPSSLDLEETFTGYARAAAVELAERAANGGADSATAEDALALLYSLTVKGNGS